MGWNGYCGFIYREQWFGLADEALEDAIYDSGAFRAFLGIDMGRESVPDATTLLKFGSLLEEQGRWAGIFETIERMLVERGLLLQRGTVVDATIISAPASTKNRTKSRAGEMHQTRKGKQWYFGAKAHIGVDVESGLIHSTDATAANEADVTRTDKLLHGGESYVVGDSGYRGAHKREGMRERELTWTIAERPSRIAAMEEGPLKALTHQIEHLKAKLRARVEHRFHILKNLFGYRKVRYKGLKKNRAQIQVLFVLVNLVISKKALLA